MTIEQAVEILWNSIQKKNHRPEELKGKLTLAESYRVQLSMLARWLAVGEEQAGWKIGLTADATRSFFQATSPASGYLLKSRHFQSGHTFQFDELINPALESELCFTLKSSLKGPGVTREQVLAAIDSVAPAFEIVELRGDMVADLPLGIADNVAQKAYVTAAKIKPYPQDLDLGQITAEVRTHGEIVAKALGVEAIDNQLQSIAWLVNNLAEYGAHLEAGQCVMSGSFTKPLPIKKGDRWETCFSSVGTVSATFV